MNIKKTYLFVIFLVSTMFTKAQVTTQTLSSNGSFIVPCAVTSITVEYWGGGGGGGEATGNPAGGGGGAGGVYSYSVLGVAAGSTINYTVGIGGAGGNVGNSSPGGTSNFGAVIATGGAGGGRATTSGLSATGGLASNVGSVGSIINQGGSGGTGTFGLSAGGGGGAGGTGVGSIGNSGGATTAGTGVAGGGNGGNGGLNSGNGGAGNPGVIPGGGGGGGRAGSNTARDGGNGARGQIVIKYDNPLVAIAGANQTIISCITTSASVSGNTVTATTGSWTCISGCTSVTIATASQANTIINGLIPATSTILRWTLTSPTASCSVFSDVTLTISTTPTFVANAGPNQTIVSCTTSTAAVTGNTVSGTTGKWSCISGCSGISIVTPTLVSTNVTGLIPNNAVTLRWTLTSTTNGCVSVSNVVLVINCAATNDNPCSATAVRVNTTSICYTVTPGTVLGATTSALINNCAGSADDDVWFSFVANSSSQDISLSNVQGSTTDLFHSVYRGTCGALNATPLVCSDPNNSTVSSLTVGTTYYVRLYTTTSTTGQNTVFNLCIKPTPAAPTNTSCAKISPVCSDTPISFQAQSTGGTAPAGPNYGCLLTRPNPTWFYLEIGSSGSIAIDISANSDIDFALWGPYPSLAAASASCTSYPAPLDCSYSPSNIEQAKIANAIVGEVYVLLVTNYASIVQSINLSSSGTSLGSTNCGIVPTPIELLYFQVDLTENKEALLQWATASETNNDYFEIQRSINGYNWETLGTINGAGSSSYQHNYQFIDAKPYNPISYYRLKQIDFDKTFSMSYIVNTDFSTLLESIVNLKPNPTKNITSFNWKSTSKNNLLIELIDFKGETVFNELINIEIGTNTIDLNLSNYENGLYLIKITTNNSGKTAIQKLIKQ